VHADSPKSLYLPSAQAMHVVAFVDENVPAAHGVQIDEPGAPLIAPALQGAHDACPVASWYRPGEQDAHANDPVAG
jgi:hypothetical protein